MPKLGYRKDDDVRTYPVTVSLPGYILDRLDDELKAGTATSRSKLLVQIVQFWIDCNGTPPEKDPDLIEEDLDRFRGFKM